MLLKVTPRNLVNFAFIVAFSTCVIFTFNLSTVQYAELYLFLLVAPKAFWMIYGPMRKGFSHGMSVWFRHRHAA
jgi:hypothetical protein